MLLCALAFCGSGCKSGGYTKIPDSIPAVGGAVEKTQAHVESADRLVRAAKPESNDTGKKMLSIASVEHAAALEELEGARTLVQESIEQRDKMEGVVTDQSTRITELENSPGYRVQVWVTRFLWMIAGLTIFHYVGGLAALFIPGNIGKVIAQLAVIANPGSWFQSLRDNYWFRSKAR